MKLYNIHTEATYEVNGLKPEDLSQCLSSEAEITDIAETDTLVKITFTLKNVKGFASILSKVPIETWRQIPCDS